MGSCLPIAILIKNYKIAIGPNPSLAVSVRQTPTLSCKTMTWTLFTWNGKGSKQRTTCKWDFASWPISVPQTHLRCWRLALNAMTTKELFRIVPRFYNDCNKFFIMICFVILVRFDRLSKGMRGHVLTCLSNPKCFLLYIYIFFLFF